MPCLPCIRNLKRVSSIALIGSIGLCIPQGGIAHVIRHPREDNRTLLLKNLENLDEIQDTFDSFRDVIEESEDPIAAGKGILEALVFEINSQHGTSLTVFQICRLAKENMHTLNLDSNAKIVLLEMIQLLEAKESPQNSASCCYNWPNLSQLLHEKKQTKPLTPNSSHRVLKDDGHGGLIMGGVEILAGFGIGIAAGWTGAGGVIAGAVMGDGFARIVNDGLETGRREKEQRLKGNEGKPEIGIGTQF